MGRNMQAFKNEAMREEFRKLTERMTTEQ